MRPSPIWLCITWAILALALLPAAAQEVVIDQTGTLDGEQQRLLGDAQRALQEQSGIGIALAFFPEIPKEEATQRRSQIMEKLEQEGLVTGAFALFAFSGQRSISYTSTREFGERLSSEAVRAAWSSLPEGLEFTASVAAFLAALGRTAGGGGAPGDGVTAPPTVVGPPTSASFPVTPVKQEELRPSAQPQTVSHGRQISVTVPGGVLTEPTTLSIGAVTALPAEAEGSFQSLGAYEVSLGDLHEFDRDILIEVPYDPARLEPGEPLSEQIMALRWDEQAGCWTEVPCGFDEARRRVIARTDHLSVLNFIYRIEVVLYNCLWENFTHTCIRVKHFRFYYKLPAIETSRTVAGWRCEANPDPAYNYLYAYSNPNWNNFMRDVSYYLEKSYDAYVKAGLDPLGKIPVVVKTGPDAAGTDPACYEHGTKRLYVSSNRVISRADLKHKLAHELFHSFQSSALGYDVSVATGTVAKWWMEASAEYASCRVPWTLDEMGGSVHSIYPYLLQYPLPYCGVPNDGHGVKGFNELEYDKGYYLDHLVRSGAKFGQLFKEISRALLDARDGKPMGAGGPILSTIRAHVATVVQRPVRDVYREFAAWFLFSAEAPLARALPPDDDPLACIDNPNRALIVFPPPKTDPQTGQTQVYRKTHAMDLPGGYTAKVFAVKPELEAGSTTPRPMVVRPIALPDETSLDVFCLPEGTRVPGQPQPQATIEPGGKGVLCDVEPNHILYVVACNTSPENAAKVELEVYDYAITLEITVGGQTVTGPGTP